MNSNPTSNVDAGGPPAVQPNTKPRTKLRRPDDTLGGCMWLPRHIDKVRHFLAGTLASDYQRAFCSPLGIDGIFFNHFGLTKDDIVDRIRGGESDEQIAAWFCARPESSRERIAAWNELAPNIGRPGYPGDRALQWGLKHVYAGCTDPRVTSGFTAIAWDEGFLE